jgi:hypothetical protein
MTRTIDPEVIKRGDILYAGGERCVVKFVRRYKDTKRATVEFDDGKRATFECNQFSWSETAVRYGATRELLTPAENELKALCFALITTLRIAVGHAMSRSLTIAQAYRITEALKEFAPQPKVTSGTR